MKDPYWELLAVVGGKLKNRQVGAKNHHFIKDIGNIVIAPAVVLKSRNQTHNKSFGVQLLNNAQGSTTTVSFSSVYSSVHGERPSAEYAKLRKESLENQFGRALDSKSVSTFYRFGPFLALYRAAIISFHVLKLSIWSLCVGDMKIRAVKFRETLISLGPFYIKLGQALSTRPDILPKIYCNELAELQDQIPSFTTNVAIKSIEDQLGMPISHIFADISKEPIAAASLGQVYKAHLHSGELVAVKVQRPHMSHLLTLDALLFRMIGGQLKRFAKARKDLLVAVNEMVRHV